MAVTMVGFKLIFLILSLTFALFLAGLNQVVSEQAVDGPSPLDTMIQRLQQEQDQRLGTNDISAAASNTRSSRGRSHDIKAMLTVYSDSFPTQISFVLIFLDSSHYSHLSIAALICWSIILHLKQTCLLRLINS